MSTDTAFVLTVLVLGYAVVSGLVNRWYLAPGLIFVAFGILLGPFGFRLVDTGPDAQAADGRQVTLASFVRTPAGRRPVRRARPRPWSWCRV